ncbi:carbohydrate ABC transporter permease [Rhizohabitans arisaemae]|uniref:carbohydrate ABC transporter permease n=1 Tax=Rhizohabitans arisaemae TaxID=2720610 RepID=UPI0024B07AE8|nr:carbohydrate ABC transporter permease [Rhizohabitans arisaemae]
MSRTRRNDLLISIALTVIAFLGLFPYLFMVITSFKSTEQFYENYWLPAFPLHLDNYARAWEQIQPYMTVTLIVAAGTIAATILLGSVAATVLARHRPPGHKVILGLISALMMVPSIASIIPLFVLMRDLGLLDSVIGLIIPMTVAGVVFAVIVLHNYIKQIPREMYEAAMLDGAGGIRMYFSIVLPVIRPAIGTVALISVINVWNEYFWPSLIISDNSLRTIPVGLQFFKGQTSTDWGAQFAGFFIASLPMLLLFTFLSKQFLAGMRGGLSVDR